MEKKNTVVLLQSLNAIHIMDKIQRILKNYLKSSPRKVMGFGNAKVFGSAQVYGEIKVFENARAFGKVEVQGNAELRDNYVICDDTKIFG